jgi:hypothetical protein
MTISKKRKMKKKVCPSRDKNEKFYFSLRIKLYNSIQSFSEIISNKFFKSLDYDHRFLKCALNSQKYTTV